MDAITNLMQNLEISKDSFLGKDLADDKDFLQKVELSFKYQNFEHFRQNMSQVMKMYLN